MTADVTKNESDTSIHPNNDSQRKLICKKCKLGEMLPAIEEGDPEYTDNFICSNCQHRDTIPTRDLLFSQVVSGLTGLVICIYLLSDQLSKLFRGIQHDTLVNPLATGALIVLAGLFLSGFIYVLFKAQDGFKHRKLYSGRRE